MAKGTRDLVQVESQNSVLKVICNHFATMACFRAIYEEIDVHHCKGTQNHSDC